jgi:cell division protein FtsB
LTYFIRLNWLLTLIDLSGQIEKELEAEADHLTKEKKKLVEENEKMQHQIQEIKVTMMLYKILM